jgi:vacuolar-type H+-ATPase subunit I/STV1
MTSLAAPRTLIKLTAILCLTVVGLCLAFPAVGEEERPARPAPLEPEVLKRVWRMEVFAAAASLKIAREDRSKLVEAYVSARQSFEDKTRELPRTRESFEERRKLAEKAGAELKEALTKAVGAENAEKIIAALSPFGMMSSRLDRMVAQLIGFELPREKLRKAVGAVLEYNTELNKAFTAAREAGSFEGAREKMQALTEALNKQMAEILSAEQMATWKESQARPSGARRPQQ